LDGVICCSALESSSLVCWQLSKSVRGLRWNAIDLVGEHYRSTSMAALSNLPASIFGQLAAEGNSELYPPIHELFVSGLISGEL
jgi:hypothetical protein